MNKEQKINYIFFWLQCFGDRDNETFHKDVTVNGQLWNIWRQFDYTKDGERIEPINSVSYSTKLVKGWNVEDLSEEQLDSLIEALKEHQIYW